MTMTRSTDQGISTFTRVWFARESLKYAGPVVVLDGFGIVKPIPKNSGTSVQFKRPVTLNAETVPLVEGVTPTPKQFRYEAVTANIKQYGFIIGITDVIEDTAEPPVLQDAAVQVGENVARTKEALDWGVLRAGTNVFYANGTARTDVNTPVSLAKLRAVTRALENQKAMMVTSALSSSPNFATRAVEAGWVAVCHTTLKSDIRNLPGFLPVSQYGTRDKVHPREFGTVEEIRFVTSPDLPPFADGGGDKLTMVSTSGTKADVYPILIFGKEAYGTVPLRGEGAITPTILKPNTPDKSDILGQRGYVGVKFWHGTVRLNELWMARLEVAATSL